MDVGRVWKCSVSIKPLVKRMWTQKTLREYKSWKNEFAPSRTDLLLEMCRTYNKAKKSTKEWGSFEEVKQIKYLLPDLKSGFSSMSASLLMSSCRFSSSCNKTWNSRLKFIPTACPQIELTTLRAKIEWVYPETLWNANDKIISWFSSNQRRWVIIPPVTQGWGAMMPKWTNTKMVKYSYLNHSEVCFG